MSTADKGFSGRKPPFHADPIPSNLHGQRKMPIITAEGADYMERMNQDLERRSPANAQDIRFGLILSGTITLCAVLVRAVLIPWHEQERFQSITGFLNGLDHLLQLPGWMISGSLGLSVGGYSKRSAWLILLGMNALVYFSIGFFIRACWQRMAASSPDFRETAPAVPGRKTVSGMCTRRRFLANSVKVLGGAAGAGCGYALVAEPRWFRITHHEMPIRDLPKELDGLRVVQLTDIHHGPWLSIAYVREVVEASNRLEPDLVLLTGDYVLMSPVYIEPVVAELARLRPRIGTVAVLGNHDWWEDAPRLQRAFAGVNIPLLDNTRRILTPDRQLAEVAKEGLSLSGVGDLWEDRPNYQRALGGLPASMPRLLLSHNPDVAEESLLTRSGLRIDLMISGHTHGGQIYIPGLGTPRIPSRYGQKYAQGLVQGPVCPVFVCRGIGTSVLPVRCGVPPEIAVLKLRTLTG